MVKGAIHPNGSNFRRVARLDVVSRVRRLVEVDLLDRPSWLEYCERVPPMENHNLRLQARTVRNPYPQMIRFLLKKHPNLRFQDCYVDGNDWAIGQDAYRADHPVMQFVARQLHYMRTEGKSKKDAFKLAEGDFRKRASELEQEHKVTMAIAMDEFLEPMFKTTEGRRKITMGVLQDAGVGPMFATGQAYLQSEMVKAEATHLNGIRRQLRDMRRKARDAKLQEDNVPEAEARFEVGDRVRCREPPTEGGDEGRKRFPAVVTEVKGTTVTVRFEILPPLKEGTEARRDVEYQVDLTSQGVDIDLDLRRQEEDTLNRLDAQRRSFLVGKKAPDPAQEADAAPAQARQEAGAAPEQQLQPPAGTTQQPAAAGTADDADDEVINLKQARKPPDGQGDDDDLEIVRTSPAPREKAAGAPKKSAADYGDLLRGGPEAADDVDKDRGRREQGSEDLDDDELHAPVSRSGIAGARGSRGGGGRGGRGGGGMPGGGLNDE